ncbi:MAG TPA: hypothetical protein VGO17_00975 [Aurantimonas sp.]|nr:hypothetical protein [Aurantimonas sp.]
MTDFFDWLTAGDSGLAADRLADAFKLSQQEMRKITDALAPAFSLALQRTTADPAAWANLSQHFLPFWSANVPAEPELARSAAARDLATALFGSRELAAAVSRQVSMASGVTPDTVETLMRNLSIMTMQTMVQAMVANAARNQPKGLAEGNYPLAMAEMMRRGANAMEAMGRPSDAPARGEARTQGSDYLAGLFGNALKGELPWLPPVGGAKRAEAGPGAPPADPSAAFLPFGAMMDGFLRGMAPSAEAPEKPGAADGGPAGASPPEAEKPEEAETADFLAAGSRMQDEYARQMLAIFRRYGGGDPKAD